MYVKQLLIILSSFLAGHILSSGLGLPIPASVVGLLILFLLLLLRIAKLEDVEHTADFIIQHLALFFVPPTVGLALYFDLLSSQLLQIFVPLAASILVGFFVTGRVTQAMIRWMAARRLSRSDGRRGGGER